MIYSINKSYVAVVASAAAGVATGVGAVAVVSAAGTVTGLSAAGITSGLAAVGATVGGGMVAGVAVCALAPVAVAVSVYALVSWLW